MEHGSGFFSIADDGARYEEIELSPESTQELGGTLSRLSEFAELVLQHWKGKGSRDDAERFLELARGVEYYAYEEPDAEQAALFAIQAGAAAQRLILRLGEPHIKAAFEAMKARQKGGIERNASYQQERERYQSKVDEYVENGHSYTNACRLAAQHDFKAGFETIRKYTTNKKPMNRGPRKKGR